MKQTIILDKLLKIGNFVEYLDFALFVLMTDSIVRNLLGIDKEQSVYYGYLIFAVTCFMRPIGGYFLGNLSDKNGRVKSLTYSILLMGICSILIALLPSYKILGSWTAVFLLILRGIQCFSMGGEFINGLVILYEIHNSKTLGYKIGSFIGIGTLGWFTAATMIEITKFFYDIYLEEDTIWRILFLIVGILAIVTFMLRKTYITTDLLPTIAPLNRTYEKKLDFNFILHASKHLSIMLFAGWNGSLFYGLFTFPLSLNIVKHIEYMGINFNYFYICITLYIPFLVITGLIIDKIGNKLLLKLLIVICSICSVLSVFVLLNNSQIFIAAAISSFITALVMNITVISIPPLLNQQVRSKYSCWYYNLGLSCLGSTSPYFCTLLSTHLSQIYAVLYITSISLVAGIMLIKSDKYINNTTLAMC